MASRNVGPVSLPVPGWAIPPGLPASPPPIDYSKLLDKLLPPSDGEDMTRLRTGLVDAVNSDGTVNVGISGLVVPNVPRLAGAPMVAGTIVNILVWRGGLLVIGPTSVGPAPLVPVSIHTAACTSDTTGGLTVTDITGMTFNFTTTVANQIMVANLVIDWAPNPANTSVYTAYLNLDGVDISSPQVVADVPTSGASSGAGRRSGVQQYKITIASAGNHTLKGRVIRTGSGVILVKATHSTLFGTLYAPR